MSTVPLFQCIENKQVVYRGKECMEKFYESSREHAIKITNFEKIYLSIYTYTIYIYIYIYIFSLKKQTFINKILMKN